MLILLGAEKRVEIGHAVLFGILRVEQEERGLGELDVGEAEIERRFQLGRGESADLVGCGLTRGDSLLGDLEHRLAAENVVEGLIDG